MPKFITYRRPASVRQDRLAFGRNKPPRPAKSRLPQQPLLPGTPTK
jgi:hypothetical protein